MNALRPLKRPAFGLAIATLILTTLTCATEAAERRICLFDFYLFGTGGSVLCDQPGKPVVVDTSCKAFEPIRYSKTDTEETKRKVREHNAAWDALCKKD